MKSIRIISNQTLRDLSASHSWLGVISFLAEGANLATNPLGGSLRSMMTSLRN